MKSYNFMDRSSGKYNLSNYHKSILNEDMSILDVGVGTTDLAQSIKFKKYIGVDISQNTVDKLKNLGFEAYLLNAVEISDKFDENSFDCIFISHVIEHLTRDEIIKFITSAKKILKKGGKIIIVAPSTSAFFFYSEWTHIRPHDHSSLSGLLKDFNFTDIVWNYTNIYFLPKFIQKILCKFKIGTIVKEITVYGSNK